METSCEPLNFRIHKALTFNSLTPCLRSLAAGRVGGSSLVCSVDISVSCSSTTWCSDEQLTLTTWSEEQLILGGGRALPRAGSTLRSLEDDKGFASANNGLVSAGSGLTGFVGLEVRLLDDDDNGWTGLEKDLPGSAFFTGDVCLADFGLLSKGSCLAGLPLVVPPLEQNGNNAIVSKQEKMKSNLWNFSFFFLTNDLKTKKTKQGPL